ncbi:MAG: hypothetical protein O3B87_04045 [bacterium]|nr:hypothetical protein [bacterium]
MEPIKKPPTHLLHMINNQVNSKNPWPLVTGVVIGALLLGSLTGFGIKSFTGGSSSFSNSKKNVETKDASGAKTSAGITDKEAFPDEVEGTLEEGGLDGEGSFHLVRPGGESQYVYLTSTTVDLSEFIGKKVSINGQTFAAEKAGWLMDVGYIEVIK